MVIEKKQVESESRTPFVKITRMEGILPRGCLPKDYLESGERIFSCIGRDKKQKVVIVLNGNKDNPYVVAKLYRGKKIPLDDWVNIIYPTIKSAGNRLHEIRSAKRKSDMICTDIF